MFDPSSFADTSRDVLPRGGTSQLINASEATVIVWEFCTNISGAAARLELRQFGDNIKDWLLSPFWSQFEQIHKDEDIAPNDKFQYLIQATVSGPRAREIVESFPPTVKKLLRAYNRVLVEKIF
ncbi:uncharacterized protein TNCV_2165321 [Trichonephila clavipes]|nr:uncharacterized protein TNCV_2165321 [Trichonephila clavipes]